MSRFSETIAAYSPGRQSSYDVKAELQVRKMLEKHTGWNFEFTRTADIYQTDITCLRYAIGDGWTRDIAGFVEVEESSQWHDGVYPPHWRFYSYLKRKVFAYNHNTKVFEECPVENADKTFYLKVARDLSDCHCSLVSDIHEHAVASIDNRDGLGRDEYNRVMLRLKMDSPFVCRGWEQSICAIKSKFSEHGPTV